ncbi:hypothetical protein [Altererythrobacter sp. GH1-8]|uniref:hypothetical protein n=1 Tax=Altererythrobacter sp. GH1-8 TaxID=3349333 RepID=UPI00374D97C6
MFTGRLGLALLLAAFLPGAIHAQQQAPREIVEQAVDAHGGELWLSPGTLRLRGHAEFYSPGGTQPRSSADDYRMWRVMGSERDSAHGADGKVRISARSGSTTIFEVGFNGETTWTNNGIMPKAEADAYWASNFGFGIIRSALNEGFKLESAPPRDVEGAPVDLVRIIDPTGQITLFGFDQDSRFIRYMGFRTPRGWHERTYSDFIKLPESGWVQARSVKLYYDGVLSNTVFWEETIVGEPLSNDLFDPPFARHGLETDNDTGD